MSFSWIYIIEKLESRTTVDFSFLADEHIFLLSTHTYTYTYIKREREGLFGSFSWSDVRFWGRDVYVYRL